MPEVRGARPATLHYQVLLFVLILVITAYNRTVQLYNRANNRTINTIVQLVYCILPLLGIVLLPLIGIVLLCTAYSLY